MPHCWVYILKCADGSYYVGQTDDVERRLSEHELGMSTYTAKRLPVVLMWTGDMPDRAQAMTLEQQLKGWSRAKKEALIRGDWDAISELAKKLNWDARRLRERAKAVGDGDDTS